MNRRPRTSKIFAAALLLAFACTPALYSQHTTALQPDAPPPTAPVSSSKTAATRSS